MLKGGRFSDRIIATHDIPPRDAQFAPIPATLHPALHEALSQRKIDQLYSHQAEMIDHALAGDDVVITTGTASGKSLAFLLPVLQTLMEDPSARAFLLYPTKALARDQLRAILSLAEELRAGGEGGRRIEAGVYDGDTPPSQRKRIRDRANLVLTNPDMLNAGLIPAHGRQGMNHLFRNVRYVVIDELHTYRGAFGAHFANLMRRFLRLCKHYGSRPRFLASSATIANPAELAETLCHRPFKLVERDGSPSGGKTIHFWLPPLLDDDVRRSVVSEMAQLVPHLIEKRHKTIAFTRSRKETEIILKESRDQLAHVHRDHDESHLLAAYRGGYKPSERRKVELDLIEGRLMGVISTNALELGIDIGSLEVVVQGGFPGTRASFWQQLGRAGRRGDKAHAIVLLAMSPIDQYIAQDPGWLLNQEAEHAVVDPDNLAVQLAHIRSAAGELPLTIDDAAVWPDLSEIIPVLLEAGELREVRGTWHWTGNAFPAGDFSLRNSDGDRFKVVNRISGETLTEMTRPQTYREAHPRAIYLHDGVQYLVEELDLVGHRSVVVPVDQNFYTQPDVRTHIEVLVTQEMQDIALTQGNFGDVRVDETVVGFKMLQFHNHENLGYERLHQELQMKLETEAVWWVVPERVLAALGGEPRDVVRGLVHALRVVARLKTMAERSDLLATSFTFTDDNDGRTRTAVVCYDNHPGGIGFAAKAYDFVDVLPREALALVQGCACSAGCPACVGSFTISKNAVAWGLANLFTETPPPRGMHAYRRPPSRPRPLVEPREQRKFTWEQLEERWQAFCEHLTRSGEHGADLLSQRVQRAEIRGNKLVLHVHSPGLVRWIQGEETRRQLRNTIKAHVLTPKGWRLAAEVSTEEAATASRRLHRVRRRLEDMRADEAENERRANHKLASGLLLETEERQLRAEKEAFMVPGDGSVN